MMGDKTANVTSDSRQHTLQWDPNNLVNLDEWKHTQMYQNNSGYRPVVRREVRPVSKLYHHNTTNYQTVVQPSQSRRNMLLEQQQQVSCQQVHHQLSQQQQVHHHQQFQLQPQQRHHQMFEQQLYNAYSRSPGMGEQTNLRAKEREHNTNKSHLQLQATSTIRPNALSCNTLEGYNASFNNKDTEMAGCGKNVGKYFQIGDKIFSEEELLQMNAYTLSVKTKDILYEKEKLKCEKQALVNKVERLENSLSKWQNAYDQRQTCFDGIHDETTKELKGTKEELDRKISYLAKLRLQVQEKDVELEKIQNKLKQARRNTRKNKSVLKKLREIVVKRNAEIVELKRENNDLKNHVEKWEKECEELKAQVAKLEVGRAPEKERRDKLIEYSAKYFNRCLKRKTKEIISFMKSRKDLLNGEKRLMEPNSGEEGCSSRKMCKLESQKSQVGQISDAARATSKKLIKMKMKSKKCNMKKHFSNDGDSLYRNDSSSTEVGMEVGEAENDFHKETGENKKKDGYEKRVCSIAKTRLPQWKHLLETGVSTLEMAEQECKE